MIKKIASLLLFTALLGQFNAAAQFYKENSGEFIFAFSNVERNELDVPSKMRFTLFFHAGQNMHYDFTNNIGFFSGYGIRNIGIITEENDVVIKRRTYALGVPLALKIGSFNDHVYFYGGGELELFFHYKQKQFKDGIKTRQREWFSDRTERFVPSMFAGIQFPGGINLKLKYYPQTSKERSFLCDH